MSHLIDLYDYLQVEIRLVYSNLRKSYRQIELIVTQEDLDEAEKIFQVITSTGETKDVVLLGMYDNKGLLVADYNNRDIESTYFVSLSDIFDIKDRINLVELLIEKTK